MIKNELKQSYKNMKLKQILVEFFMILCDMDQYACVFLKREPSKTILHEYLRNFKRTFVIKEILKF